MHIEYECTLLEVNKEEFIKKLEENNATLKGNYFQKRYVYDLIPKQPNKWLRLRTNGEKTTLTIKNVVDTNAIGGTEELEIEVSDFELTHQILKELGYNHRGYQENKRITYELDGVEIDIDSWPMIPDYVEIEGKNEEDVKRIIKKLNLEDLKIVNCDVVTIYNDYYNIDIMGIKDLRFE